MGVDLALLPVEHEGGTWGYSHSIMQVGRNYSLYDTIRALPDAGPVPEKFSTFYGRVPDGKNEGEHGYGDTPEDPYGQALRCVYAKDIAAIKLPKDADPSLRAPIAYCRELKPMTRIALYWH